METESSPSENDKQVARNMITNIIRDIDMHLLAAPHVYYLKHPLFNEGLTAIAPIETSHIAFHFWKTPEKNILQNPKSKCLLQFDLYTCGSLTPGHLYKILQHLTQFKPTHADATVLNRNHSLSLVRHLAWDRDEKDWGDWLSSVKHM
jgi:S-adenosylmethionine/arginine decarboxylase-like enzyme